MKEGLIRKALQYLCINPNFDIHKITRGALRYSPNKKPVLLHNGQTSYGRLEMFELLPREHMRSFIYVGWRDFNEADEKLFRIAQAMRGKTEL